MAHFRTYTDASGNEFPSYELACHFYGADSPADLALEAEYDAAEWLEHCLKYALFLSSDGPDPNDLPF